MIKIIEVEKLTHHRGAHVLAMQISVPLMETGVFNYGPAWSIPTIVALDGERCVGMLSYEEDDDDLKIGVGLCGVDPEYRGGGVLGLLLMHLRDKYSGTKFKTIGFSYSPDNPSMRKAAELFGARIVNIRAEYMLPPKLQPVADKELSDEKDNSGSSLIRLRDALKRNLGGCCEVAKRYLSSDRHQRD